MSAEPNVSRSLKAGLDDLALVSILIVIAGILTAAMVLQYADGEIPCPLCLLQRVAMFGVCFGLMRRFRDDDRASGIGIGLVSAAALLVVAARQTLIDICPLPDRHYVGSAVFGLHMPVWSVIVALAVITTLSLQLAALSGGGMPQARPARLAARVAGLAGFYVTALCAINLVSALLQCGFGACHTAGYRML